MGSSGGNGGAIYCERAPAGNDIWKFRTTGNTNLGLVFTHRDDAGALSQPSITVTINDGIWHHVGFTKAATSIKFYVDGVQSGSTGTLTGTNTFTDASPTTIIGNDPVDLGASSFTGKMDELLLFNTALTAGEVLALYTSGTIPTGLIDTYHFDEGTGTTSADSTGSNTATLVSSTMWTSDTPTLPSSNSLRKLILLGVG